MYSQEKIFEMGAHLSEIGFGLHWLKPASKKPVKNLWSTAENISWPELIQDYQAGFNLGCRAGEYSRFSDNTCLVVFDVDLKGGSHFLEEALSKLKSILNSDIAHFPFVISPRGRHYYARCALEYLPKNMKLAESQEVCTIEINGALQQRQSWQIELMGTGRQVVLPPSLHPDTQTCYQLGEQWICAFEDIPLLSNATLSRVSSFGNTSSKQIKPKNFLPLSLENIEINKLPISEELKTLISLGAPKGERSEGLFKATVALKKSGVADEIICSLLTDNQYKLSEKPLEERSQNRQSAAQWVYDYCVKKANIDLSPPIPLNAEYIKPTEPPLEKLGELGDIIKQVADCIQAPPSIALQSCLASLNFLTQGIGNIESEIGSIPTSLYFVTVAQSGDRKTTVDKFFLKSIRAYEKGLIDTYDLDRKKYQADTKANQVKEKEILGKKEVNIAQVSKSLQVLPDVVRPRYPILIIEEPTYEGLVKHIDEDYPSVALFSSEGGRFIGGHAMNKENVLKTISGLSSIWDGDPITRLRQSDGAKCIRDRRVCLHFLIQPIILQQMLEQNLLEGQGFLSRIILVAPESIAGTRLYKNSDSGKLAALQRRYTDLINPLLTKTLDFNQKTGNINFSCIEIEETAHSLWVNFYNEVEQALSEKGRYADIRNFACKAGELTRRLAATLLLTTNPDSRNIDDTHMEQAIALMRYYLEEQLRIKTLQLQDPDIVLAKKVLEKLVDYFLEKQQTIFTLADIYKNMREVRNTKRAREIFTLLEEHGYLFKCPVQKSNRMKNRESWQLNSTFLASLKS